MRLKHSKNKYPVCINKNTIYAICDYNNLQKNNISIKEFINICNRYNVAIIQYRDKQSSLKQKLANLKILRRYWDKILIINDEIELINFCDGLHLGQDDLKKFAINKKVAINRVRRKIGYSILGLSTHNFKEVFEANNLDIDYIGLGAYKKSVTKDVKFILGKRVSNIAKVSKKPVAVIGSVKKNDNIKNVDFLAISSDLLKD